MKPIEEGLWQIFRSRDGMRLSGCLDGAQRALERLWNLNHATAIEEPLDRLRMVTIEAFTCLIPILWRDPGPFRTPGMEDQNMKDYEAAIEVIES